MGFGLFSGSAIEGFCRCPLKYDAKMSGEISTWELTEKDGSFGKHRDTTTFYLAGTPKMDWL